MTTQTTQMPTATDTEAGFTAADIEAGVAAAETARTRLDFATASRKTYRAIAALGMAAREGLDPALVELVQIRASHLNGCAYCLHMHTNDARKAGEHEDRLHLVPLWREARHFYTSKERAALALTESLTLPQGGVSDAVYTEAASHFDDHELAQLIALICTINTWNRVALATGKVAGTDER
ncbi:carboxymuconolactone decarboxylase family protein [Streptomyces acidiscabies]|uniref:4-carboxymuconolactone decarboxylase n=1 Tax=Streptomyces acidiscabies TaxID=42234 RepID=A0A0L0KLH7_9ACTN|nr:carboxymuconolactone decarboxylase family protein [Streptomyces acidiscabies]KND38439.1 4-carboxymuconolactone decarboxylase [Streptomyces acidiscabies]